MLTRTQAPGSMPEARTRPSRPRQERVLKS